MNRRSFVKQSAAAAVAFSIVPRFVLGGRGYRVPSDRLTIGFIGTGKQSRGLVRQFAPLAQVLAGSDVDSRKLAWFKEITEKTYAELKGQPQYKGFKAHADFREILERDDIDAVVIATPDHWHAVGTIMAAGAGKHVYCEKPLARTVKEGRAMVKAVERNNIILQTGSMQRSRRDFRHACELVRNGYLGEIREVLVSVGDPAVPCNLPEEPVPSYLDWDGWLGPAEYRPYNPELSPPVEQDIFPHWRNYKEFAGGILSDWGAHMFDIAQWALDKDRSGPVQLFPPDGKEYKTLTMVYEDGVVMKHEDFGRGYGVRFTGTKGRLDVSRQYLDSDPAGIAQAAIQAGETRLYKSENHYQDWIDAIRKDKPPICDVETGHRTSTVCCIANIAYWLNRPLVWDPRREKFKGDREANKLRKGPVRSPWKLK